MSFRDLVADMDRTIQDVLGGVSVVYETLSGGVADPAPVGMFDANYVSTRGKNVALANSTPSVVFKLADLPEDPRDIAPTSITIQSVAYKVRGIETDGEQGGSIRLNLKKA